MLRSAAVTRVQEGLGFRTDQADRIVARLQEAQRDLERGKTLPKFLLVEDQTLAFTQGSSMVALPANFLRRAETNMRYLPAESERYVFVPWRSYNDAYRAYANSDASGPKVAVLRTASVFFFPSADRDYTLYWDYYVKDTILDTDTENLWLEHAPELLIGFAGLRMARDLRNKEAVGLFEAMYGTARQTWLAETVVQDAEEEICLGSDN